MVKYTERELLDELRAVGFLHEDELISPRDIEILRKCENFYFLFFHFQKLAYFLQ